MPKTPTPLLAAFAIAALVVGCQPSVPRDAGATRAPRPTPEAPGAVAPTFREIAIRSVSARVPVIMYHDIVAVRDRHSQWFDCSESEFEAQMAYLQEHGAVPIRIDDLYAHLSEGKSVPDKAVVLTFDDNYQGFYDHALPILKKYNYPATMFVHTGFVGSKEGEHPKMSWDTLRELQRDGLITIESHTITHPEDISKLSPDAQTKELVESKKTLEEHLGAKIDYLAYPNGANDAVTQGLAKDAGYKMAFSTINILAEESPSILCVGRYVHTRLEKAWDDAEAARALATALFESPLTNSPVTSRSGEFEGVQLALVEGGLPVSRHITGRKGVSEFIEEAGGVAGINGGYFPMAAIHSEDSQMIGPYLASNEKTFHPDLNPLLADKVRNRPMLVWGPQRFAVVPLQPETMNREEAIREFMPDATDAFLGGVWMVHEGTARSREELLRYSAKDIMDPRKRAFLGVRADGAMVIGASLKSTTTERLARAAAAAGLREAVLLDSGFSTSLVYNGEILASGHSTRDRPSRPVPHAIVVMGKIASGTDTKHPRVDKG